MLANNVFDKLHLTYSSALTSSTLLIVSYSGWKILEGRLLVNVNKVFKIAGDVNYVRFKSGNNVKKISILIHEKYCERIKCYINNL